LFWQPLPIVMRSANVPMIVNPFLAAPMTRLLSVGGAVTRGPGEMNVAANARGKQRARQGLGGAGGTSEMGGATSIFITPAPPALPAAPAGRVCSIAAYLRCPAGAAQALTSPLLSPSI